MHHTRSYAVRTSKRRISPISAAPGHLLCEVFNFYFFSQFSPFIFVYGMLAGAAGIAAKALSKTLEAT